MAFPSSASARPSPKSCACGPITTTSNIRSRLAAWGFRRTRRGALSVGAIHYGQWDLGTLASYSSRGPYRRWPHQARPSSRQAGVTTVSYGESGFVGTSAAAPHMAGAAALLKSGHSFALARRSLKALVEAAVDLGAPGKDDSTGYGKLVLSVLTPQVADVSPRRVAIRPNSYHRRPRFRAQIEGRAKWSFLRERSRAIPDYLAWSDAQIQVRVPTSARTGKVLVIAGGRPRQRAGGRCVPLH